MQRKIGTAIHHAALPFYLLCKANGNAQENRGCRFRKENGEVFFHRGMRKTRFPPILVIAQKKGKKMSQKQKKEYIISEEES